MGMKLLAVIAAVAASLNVAASSTVAAQVQWTPEPGAPPITIATVTRPAKPPEPLAVPPNEAALAISDSLIEPLRSGMTIDRYLSNMLGQIAAVDRDRNGIDKADLDYFHLAQRTQARASAVGGILNYDTDGNFRVTEAELRQRLISPADPRGGSRQVDQLLESYDLDNDRSITLDEAAEVGVQDVRDETGADKLFALDPDENGTLTETELRGLAEPAFRIVDRDGDGTISKDEDAAIADQRNRAMWRRTSPSCPLPAVPKGARVIAFGTYSSEALSTVAVGGLDKETNLLDINIEPGREPLYLVLTSYESMIWRFTGDTGRIVQVVANAYTGAEDGIVRVTTPSPPGVIVEQRVARTVTAPSRVPAIGVIGIPATKVTIARTGCWDYFDEPNDPRGKRSIAVIEGALGHKADAAFGRHNAQFVALPSGTISLPNREAGPLPPDGFDEGVWPDAARFWSGGLVEVDPAEVVAAAKVEPYSVLPSQMGLAQLVGSGAAVRNSDRSYTILKPIPHLPSRMTGAHLEVIHLAEGVPLPSGDPGHACILSADGEILAGTSSICGMKAKIPPR